MLISAVFLSHTFSQSYDWKAGLYTQATNAC